MTDDPAERRRRSQVQAERMVRAAVQRRIAEGLTEAEVATRMGITPADWWLGEYVRYARAIGGAPFVSLGRGGRG
jgi:hypothetical protein